MIELKNISAGYEKGEILHALSARFEKGRLTSIVGPNGCGKSTLLKAALGMIPHSCGEIWLDGENLCTLKRNAIAKKAAYLSQGKGVPDMTAEQMVLHGRFPHLPYPRQYTGRDREIAQEAMKTAGVESFAKKQLYALSGGMRQSVYIAMALAQDTEYIFLDEPTTYLDISHQLDLMKLLRALADRGKGIVIVMHDLPLAFQFADEILVMDSGAVQAAGSPAEICRSGIVQQVFHVRLRQEGEAFYYQF